MHIKPEQVKKTDFSRIFEQRICLKNHFLQLKKGSLQLKKMGIGPTYSFSIAHGLINLTLDSFRKL